MKLIVGLGNPGVELDAIAGYYSIDVTKNKFKGLYGKGNVRGEKIVLLKPVTYMNLPGESLREAQN